MNKKSIAELSAVKNPVTLSSEAIIFCHLSNLIRCVFITYEAMNSRRTSPSSTFLSVIVRSTVNHFTPKANSLTEL